jgi:hypothetical protein
MLKTNDIESFEQIIGIEVDTMYRIILKMCGNDQTVGLYDLEFTNRNKNMMK